jgi:hypothetical protein
LLTNSSSILFPQHDLPTHKHLSRNLAFNRAGEYFRAARALAPFSPALMSSHTTLAFTTLHPKLNGYFPIFFKNYELDQDIELSSNSFKLAFQCMPHLLTSGRFGTIFEHLQICFHPKDLVSAFLQFQLCFHIAHGHIHPHITRVFKVACLLATTKPSGGVHPIIVEETLY